MYSERAATFYDETNKIWYGRRKKDFFGPNMTLGEAAHFILGLNPEKVIQVMDITGEQLTAGQLLRSSKIMANSLIRLGLNKGDIVSISATNTTHVSAIMLGAFLCGTPTNALYPEFDKESVKIVLEVTQPKIFFCDVENYHIINQAVNELNLSGEIYLVNGEIDGVKNVKDLLRDDGREITISSFPCINMTGDDTAVILCSSGTTGTPKGSRCSHKALLNQMVMPDLQSDSVLFGFSTLYWASGLWLFTAFLLNGAKRIITNKPFSAEYLLQLIEKYQITDISTSPHQIAQVLQHATPTTRQRLASLRCIICAGSKEPQIVSEKFNALLGTAPQRIGLTVAYGMSELSAMLSENDGGPEQRREGTEGKLMSNMEVRIVEKNTGDLMGINSAGVIHIRTPHKWAGYHRNEEATKKAYIDGWLITGDIGYFDDDGFLHICARDNDVFKSNNFQIYPAQIEDVIMQLAGVLEACVFGMPDFLSTNLTACAVVRTDNDHGRQIKAEDIMDYVSQKMAAIYHIKAGVFFVDALPKTGSGKVQRRKVLDLIKK